MSQSRSKVIADINKRKNNPFVCIKICTCKLVKLIHHCHWIVPDEQALIKQGNVWNQQLFISKYCLIEGKVMGGSGLQRKGQEMFWVKQLRASRVPEIISPWFGCWARIRYTFRHGYHCLAQNSQICLKQRTIIAALSLILEVSWIGSERGCKDCMTKEKACCSSG